MTTDITVLDHLVVVNLDIHIWTARKKLVPLDLGGAELPPEDLASLGSKRICNPDDLRSFGTLKARAVNLLEGNGIRFLSGWAVPDTRLPEIMRELAVIRDEFNTAKDAFLLRYDQSVQDWIAKHPQWGSIIAGSTVSEEYVRSRIDFRWQVFQVAQPAAVNATQNLDNLNDDIGQLGDTLFDEVAKAAGEAWTRCYAGKTEITRKALSPLKSIYDKLMGLTFVEPRVAPVAELLDTAFRSIPKRGSHYRQHPAHAARSGVLASESAGAHGTRPDDSGWTQEQPQDSGVVAPGRVRRAGGSRRRCRSGRKRTG